MFLLIVTIIFSRIITFFATQNATPVDIHLSSFQLTGIPLYWVVLGSVLITLVFSWIIFLTNSISSSFTLHGRDKTVQKLKEENESLSKKIHSLEIDSARIQGKMEHKTQEVKVI